MDRTLGAFDFVRSYSAARRRCRCSRCDPPWQQRSWPQVLMGKQLFYDARDPRLARDAYLGCASCHNDAGHDGRVWDLTGCGEGLRTTSASRGPTGRARLPALEQELQRGAGLRRPDPKPRGRYRVDVGCPVQCRHDVAAAGHPEGGRERRPGCAGGVRGVTEHICGESAAKHDGTLQRSGARGPCRVHAKNCASCHGGAAVHQQWCDNLQNIGTLKAERVVAVSAPRWRESTFRRCGTLGHGAVPTRRIGSRLYRRDSSAQQCRRAGCGLYRTWSHTLEIGNQESLGAANSRAALAPVSLASTSTTRRCPGRRPATYRGRGLRLGQRIAGVGVARQILGTMDRDCRSVDDRQLPVPDQFRRPGAPLDRRRPGRQQLDEAMRRRTTLAARCSLVGGHTLHDNPGVLRKYRPSSGPAPVEDARYDILRDNPASRLYTN